MKIKTEKKKKRKTKQNIEKSNQYSCTKSRTDEIELFKGKSIMIKLKEKYEAGYSIPPWVPIIVKSFTFV